MVAGNTMSYTAFRRNKKIHELKAIAPEDFEGIMTDASKGHPR
jgi:hypothetical protein